MVAALALAGLRGPARAAGLISVSADIVEISGSVDTQMGFSWNDMLEFQEMTIPGIITLGDFERKTALTTSLRMLQQQGKAQLLANPKVVVKDNEQANFVVGGELPFPSTNNQGVGVDFKKFGVILNILPSITDDKKKIMSAQLQLEVSNPDFSKPVTVGNTSVPSIVTRQVQTTVDLKSGETLVIGGLKQSQKSVSKSKIPFLGSIPLLGLLFSTKQTIEQQSSLFLFVTMEIIN